MTNTTSPPASPPVVRRLERGDGPIGGVAAGLADYFTIDPTLIRLGLAAATLISGPIIPVGYVAAWIIIPPHETDSTAAQTGPAPVPPSTPVSPAPPAPSTEPETPDSTS